MKEDTTKDGTRKEARPYSKPRLVDYGAVTKLTQGSSGTVGDGPGMAMVACL